MRQTQDWSRTSSGAPRTLSNRPSHTLNIFWCPSRTGTASWRPLHNWSSCAKWYNPSEYCVTIRDRSITRNIELSTKKTNSNNGIVISINLLDGKTWCSTFHCCMVTELIPLHHPPETGIGGVGNKKLTSKCGYRYQRLDGEACISCLGQQVSATSQVTWSPWLHPEPITGRQLQIVPNTLALCAYRQ